MASPEKTALVLSAGGMFGAYQAGAWRVLSDHVRPDIVTGASVGALNGWPVAGGCTPQHLVERWLDAATGEVLTVREDRGFGNGWSNHRWFDQAPLRAYAQSLYDDYTPQVEFGLAIVKLPDLATQLVRHPHITAEHLVATASIPLVLPPVQIGGDRYVDGGLMEKMPIWAAIEMGATHIVAIDCLLVSNWWLRAGMGLFRRLKQKRQLPPDLSLILVAPEEPLGTWNDAVVWRPENIRRWIAMGERDAARALKAAAVIQ